jgi:hypothetical protein
MQLGLENKKKATWAAVLGGLAILLVAYQFIPLLTESSTPGSSAQAAAPVAPRVTARPTTKSSKKVRVTDSLDPTLRLDLLATSEQIEYGGSGRNIFVAQSEEVTIPNPVAPGHTDVAKAQEEQNHIYVVPPLPAAAPIPLKFFGFANKTGEAKKIFLSQGEDVWVAGEGEIVNRRYKVIHIAPNSVKMQDMVNSGPPQDIPLTQG